MLALKLWEIDIQIWAPEFSCMIIVVEHPLLAEGRGKMIRPTSTPPKLQYPWSFMSSDLLLDIDNLFAARRPEARQSSPMHQLSTLLVGAMAVDPFLGQPFPEFPTRRLLGRKGGDCGPIVRIARDRLLQQTERS
jgi:hypothetical protein